MKIIDISWTISEEMTVYKDKPTKKTKIEETVSIDKGVRESRYHLDSHTGTHIDAASHALKEGDSLDLSPERFILPAIVIEVTKDVIGPADFDSSTIEPGMAVLFKTKNSQRGETKPFDYDFAYVTEDAATVLAEKRVASVGIDGLGIERNQPSHPTHNTLLGAGIQIIEGLRLAHVKPGNYKLVCAPLKIKGADGSPCRAFLIEGDL